MPTFNPAARCGLTARRQDRATCSHTAATHKTRVSLTAHTCNMAALAPKARVSLRATLVETGLLRTKGLINGKWLSAASGKTFKVHDPATDTEVASVASFGEADAKLAVSAAEQSFDAWRSKTLQVRFDNLRGLSCEITGQYSERTQPKPLETNQRYCCVRTRKTTSNPSLTGEDLRRGKIWFKLSCRHRWMCNTFPDAFKRRDAGIHSPNTLHTA